jgi:molybdopterin molybdotransferase
VGWSGSGRECYNHTASHAFRDEGRMLSVAEAQRVILENAGALSPQMVPLVPAALGLVLAEDVASDLDSPPHDKALMDGYAIRCVDLLEGRGELEVIEEVTAGKTPQRALGAGQATRIMTGAPLPDGADAVVQVERTKMVSSRVVIEDRPPRPEQNILRRGREMRCGEVVLRAGSVLRPQEFGVLATVGRTMAQVVPSPRVAILSTGDEVVEAGQTPGPGQIRNGNGPMLQAQTVRAGGAPHYLGIVRDQVDQLRAMIRQGLAADVLVLSGGVSAGKLDLVPDVLRELGVEARFHKVEMKPGKPLYFGRREGTLVFGLPGNPVSSFVCFELFVRPALARMRGRKESEPRLVQSELSEDFPYRTDRVTYHPAMLTMEDRGWRVRMVPWFGSPDMLALTRANALAVLPVGDHRHRAGQCLDVMWLDM